MQPPTLSSFKAFPLLQSKSPYPLSSFFPSSSLFSLLQPPVCVPFIYVDLSRLDISHKWANKMWDVFCLASFRRCVLGVRSHCGTCQSFIPFHDRIVSVLGRYQSLFIPSYFDGHLGCRHIFTVVNSAAVNVCVKYLIIYFQFWIYTWEWVM